MKVVLEVGPVDELSISLHVLSDDYRWVLINIRFQDVKCL